MGRETGSLANDFRLTPATLFHKIDPLWIPKSFLLKASLKIAQTIAKPDGRLIISWPPRHGKSQLATIATPIWCLENFPSENLILSTYGDSLSTGFGRQVRDIVNKNQDILSVKIRKDVKSVGHFMTEEGGGMLSVGLGGPITGKGANTFLIDDYIKTMAEALSPSKHISDWEWFTGTAYHRLEPGASMIIIATRWHANDLIGRILKHFPGEWEHVKFKALAGDEDPLGRIAGEPLFPERYDFKALMDRKKVLGTKFFDALYQQEPHDDDSDITNRDWVEIIDDISFTSSHRFARIWDFGGGKGKENDPTCGTLICVNIMTRECTVLDVWRKWASPSVVEAAVKAKGADDGVGTKVIIEQEPGASGKQLVNHYDVNVLPNHKVEPSPSTLNKVTRAQPFIGAAEDGKIRLLKRRWNEKWLTEFEDFPEGDHDDQVDTVAIGYNNLLGNLISSPIWGRELPNLTETPEEELQRMVQGATWGLRKTDRRPRRRMWH